jgi:hypothetical protein
MKRGLRRSLAHVSATHGRGRESDEDLRRKEAQGASDDLIATIGPLHDAFVGYFRRLPEVVEAAARLVGLKKERSVCDV